MVHHNQLRLLKLVNTLLDFSRIEEGRIHATFLPTDIAMFTAELASAFRSAMERAGLEYVVDCPAIGRSVVLDRRWTRSLNLQCAIRGPGFQITNSPTSSSDFIVSQTRRGAPSKEQASG
jgi:signal transduction histidine kinase